MIRILVTTASVVSLNSAIAQGVTITFDDLPGTLNPIPNGYGGLQWNTFNYEIALLGGYTNGIVSPANVAYNSYGNPASFSVTEGTFNLNSAYLTGAWNDGLQVQVQGFANGSIIYDNTYTVNTDNSTLIEFNYQGVDTVVFSSYGGNPRYVDLGDGYNFAMDNLSVTYNPVPEPATFTLLGVAAVAFILRRQKLS